MKKSILLIAIALTCTLAALGQTGNLSRINMLTYGGLPVMDSSFSKPKILINETYISAYDEDLRNPVWVAYRLGNAKGTLNVQKWERPEMFVADERTNSKVDHDVYTRSGYDRGHMAPNATMLTQYGQLGQMESFLMTNITPQKADLNQKIWADLEALERDVISQDDTPKKEVHDVYVITGPIFGANPTRIGTGVKSVAVPISFFRIIAFKQGYTGTFKAVSFIIPQDPPTQFLKDYYRTIDEIEQLTHIEFFSKLTELVQRNLESKKRDIHLKDL